MGIEWRKVFSLQYERFPTYLHTDVITNYP